MTGVKNDEEKEEEFLDDTSLDDMEEIVNDRKDDKNEEIDEEKEAEFPDYTSPVEIENMTRMEILTRKKMQNATMTLLLLIWRKV